MKHHRSIICLSLFFTLILCLIITSTTAYGQIPNFEKEVTGKTIDGLINVSSSIVKDSFVPMTHWKEKEYIITAVPAYFEVNRAYDDPEVKGRDLKGWAAGLGGGYALSERLLFYAIFATQNIKGNLYGKLYSNILPAIEADLEYRLFSFTPGIGYEFIPGKWLSIPVYFGPFIQHYKIDMELPPQEDIVAGTTIEVNASGNGFLYGLSGGFAISAKIMDTVKITPYYLYMRSFNKPDIEAKGTITSTFPILSRTYTDSLDTENLNASMIGLSATLVSTKNLSFSISVGGYITSETSWYNEKFLNGLEMKSIVLAVTYTNSQSENE